MTAQTTDRHPPGLVQGRRDRAHWALALVLVSLWAILATPPARAALESSMVMHMLVQLPLLVVVGACLAACVGDAPGANAKLRRLWDSTMRGGACGLVFAAFVSSLWMLPRLLDAAVLDPRFEFAKFVLLPAAGAALVVAWPRCPRLARVVVHVEVIATLLRFGWGYLEAPDRLCALYLLDEQVLTGRALVALGLVYALTVTWPALFGPLPLRPWALRLRRALGPAWLGRG